MTRKKPVKRRRYAITEDNEWIKPKRKGYRMMCCDCGLVHELDFAHIKNGRGIFIFFRARRNERATSTTRRKQRHITVVPHD